MTKTKTKTKYYATQQVHCPSGPTYACDEHAKQLHVVYGHLGGHTNSTKIKQNTFECANCVNENKGK